jgi:hypothetical protein
MKGFMSEYMLFETIEQLNAFMEGAEHALFTFAHYYDGVMQVGTTGTTYKSAKAQLRANYKVATGHEYGEDS